MKKKKPKVIAEGIFEQIKHIPIYTEPLKWEDIVETALNEDIKEII